MILARAIWSRKIALLALVLMAILFGEQISELEYLHQAHTWLLVHIPPWAAFSNVVFACLCPFAIPFLSEKNRLSWLVMGILAISVMIIQPCFLVLPELLSLRLWAFFNVSAIFNLIMAAIWSSREERLSRK